MAEITRRIGLSLGADVCWPLCYEALLKRLDLAIPRGGDRLRFEVERVTIEPFDLRQPVRYDLVIDRLTHWYFTSREWIKKAVVMNDLYVYNNPWSIQANEKHTTYCAMMRLGLHVPDTWMVPPKSYEQTADLKPTLTRYAKLFDLGRIGGQLGYPLFMKPYDGGGWVGVTKIDDEAKLRQAYEDSGTKLMHLQAGVIPYDRFVRCIGFGPQTRVVNYDPSAPLHDRYRMDVDFLTPAQRAELENITLTINAFFGWDFNSCESLLRGDTWHPIDFANACPDSQVQSLHFHFPWLVKANLKWSLYCAATKRRVRHTLDWEPYFMAAERESTYAARLAAYARLARAHFETDRFEEFCAKHLSHLDEVAWEFFGSQEARDAVRAKVSAIYPAHEIEPFTELFWQRIQHWRATEGARPA
ncbi:MAG: hypothetical protein O9284_14605 [Steroidobacteraceae bacterium]|jgi:hypothetical protein|nr:hypothetical protein [Steroidobacteraceae bacterium]